METHPMSAAVQRTDEEAEAFLRSVTLSEEDRRQCTSAPWRGGFRWFRSPNVIPLEQYRRSPGSEPDAA
jgi:hypothetical protein